MSWSAGVWTTEEMVTINVAGETIQKRPPVTANDIIEIAKTKGITKFVVKDPSGNLLTPEHFPINNATTLTIEEYNEAK